jgi:hypothetical protein
VRSSCEALATKWRWARLQDPAGHEPAECEGDDGDDGQGDRRLDEHLSQVTGGYLLAQREFQVEKLAGAECVEAPVDADEPGRNLNAGEGRLVDLPARRDGPLGQQVADRKQDGAAGQERAYQSLATHAKG